MFTSLFCCVVWACLPMVVSDELIGTAFGIMAAFQNSAQFLVPLILQQLYADSDSYLSSELFFMGFATLSLLLSLLLWVLDERYYGALMRLPSALSGDATKGGGGGDCDYSRVGLGDEGGGCDLEGLGGEGADDGHSGVEMRFRPPRPHTASIGSADGGNGTATVSARPISTSPQWSSRKSDNSLSPETTLTSAPIAIIAIPKTVTSDFAARSPFRALIAGQFPVSDPLELRRQMSERSRLLPPAMAYSMMSPSSFLMLGGRGEPGGGIAMAGKDGGGDYSPEPAAGQPPQDQQQPALFKKLTRSASFTSFGHL